MEGLQEMHQYSVNPRLDEFFEYDTFNSISETRELINKLLNRMSGTGMSRVASYWFIRRKSDKRLLGSASLLNLSYQRQSIEWGYGLDPDVWGLGYILQVQEMLKIIAFEVLELNRLGGLTSIKNKATISSVLASGMLNEGTIKDYMKIDNQYHDGWQYGMTKSMHEQLKGKVLYREGVSIKEIIKIVASVLPQESIGMDTAMENTASWDSLTHMNLMIELKERFGIDFSPSDIAQSNSIKSIVNILSKRFVER
jgi:RimJ/RimL family protein N-acetyltransferase/acyl carrier protein